MKLGYSVLLGIAMAGVLAAQQSNAKDPNAPTTERPGGTQNSGPPTAKPREMRPIAPQKNDLNRDVDTSVVTIPANAERLDAQHYRAKDDKGVIWNYTKTPFGVNKARADEETKPVGVSQPAEIIATDQGDNVKFERKTPFGKNTWTKKKTELDASEKAALAASSAHSMAPSPKN